MPALQSAVDAKDEGQVTTKKEVPKIQKMIERHFNAEDVGIAYDANHIWVCVDGVSLFRAKVMGGKFFATFDNVEMLVGHRETPETDREVVKLWPMHSYDEWAKWADFARNLERQRDELVEALRDVIDDNNVNPTDSDDIAAMVRFNQALSNAKTILAKIEGLPK